MNQQAVGIEGNLERRQSDVASVMAGADGTGTAILARCVSKNFGPIQALSEVNVTVRLGSIHAFVGANGAGKSTFLGCIAGRVLPSSGTIEVLGNPLAYGDPRAAHEAGIATVFQELTIVPAMSALENVFLGQAPSHYGLVGFAEMRRAYDDLCQQFHVNIPRNAVAGSLSVADQQMLEIMRCVQSDARIFIFDEPTTALALPERRSLFAAMRSLRAQGKALVIVSHNLEDVLEISDEITVFRDGRISRHGLIDEWSERNLVEAMLGRYASVQRSVRPLPPDAKDKLHIDLSVERGVQNLSIQIKRGEIVGLAGLVGSGRSSILRSLMGLRRATGRITLEGHEDPLPRTPREALARGFALIPEDRKIDGLVLDMTVEDNIIITDLKQVTNASVISKSRTRKLLEPIVGKYGFDPKRLNMPVRQLSGGNQQKILFSKWDYRSPSVLLIDEPTRGVDVGSKAEILRTLQDLAEGGLSILMVSSELEEIAAVCNTIYTISGRRVTARINNDRDHVTADHILEQLFEMKS